MSSSSGLSRLHNIFTRYKNTPKTINLPPKTVNLPPKTPNKKKLTKTEIIDEVLSEKDPQKLFEKFITRSKQSFFRRQHRVYDYTIHRLKLANQFTLIEKALDTQKAYVKTPAFAARIIYCYGKAGMFEHARKMFDELPVMDIAYGPNCFAALLGAASHCQEYDKVIEMFRGMPAELSVVPDVDCYNSVVHALCKLERFDDALLLLDEMEGKGVKPDVVTYNSLLCSFYEKREFACGEMVWDKMIDSGVTPDVGSYNFKLRGIVKEGELKKAEEFVEGLKKLGKKPNVTTYNALIQGFRDKDDLEGAKKWFIELLKSKCAPNRTTFITIVPFLCEKGDYAFAFQVCRKKLRQQCSVDEPYLQNVVDVLVKNSMIHEAEILVELGRANSYLPYNLVMPSAV